MPLSLWCTNSVAPCSSQIRSLEKGSPRWWRTLACCWRIITADWRLRQMIGSNSLECQQISFVVKRKRLQRKSINWKCVTFSFFSAYLFNLFFGRNLKIFLFPYSLHFFQSVTQVSSYFLQKWASFYLNQISLSKLRNVELRKLAAF